MPILALLPKLVMKRVLFRKSVGLVLIGFGQNYALSKLKVVLKLNPHSMQLQELSTQMNN